MSLIDYVTLVIKVAFEECCLAPVVVGISSLAFGTGSQGVYTMVNVSAGGFNAQVCLPEEDECAWDRNVSIGNKDATFCVAITGLIDQIQELVDMVPNSKK